MVSFVESSLLIAAPSALRGPASASRSTSSAEPVTAERHRAILRVLAESGKISLTQIAERFEISAATARRDATLLTNTGRACRRHGALAIATAHNNEQHFRARVFLQASAKNVIAQKAAQLLPQKGIVFVDAGTTCFEVGRILITRPNLQIVTNSIPLLELALTAQARLVSVGGEVRRVSLALTGGFTQTWLGGIRFDAAVIGAAGVDAESGAFTNEIHEAAVKADALRRANTRILVADAAKWSRPTAIHFAPWPAFTYFITNQMPPTDARPNLAASSVNVQMTTAA